MEAIILIISIVITVFICKRINRNTIGTSKAYLKRGVFTWCCVMMVLYLICSKIGLI